MQVLIKTRLRPQAYIPGAIEFFTYAQTRDTHKVLLLRRQALRQTKQQTENYVLQSIQYS